MRPTAKEVGSKREKGREKIKSDGAATLKLSFLSVIEIPEARAGAIA